jgi:hypothetical protein
MVEYWTKVVGNWIKILREFKLTRMVKKNKIKFKNDPKC